MKVISYLQQEDTENDTQWSKSSPTYDMEDYGDTSEVPIADAADDTADELYQEQEEKTPRSSHSRNQSVALETQRSDPLKLFFLSMYETVSRMPREHAFAVRRKVFDLVCEYESQQFPQPLNIAISIEQPTQAPQ